MHHAGDIYNSVDGTQCWNKSIPIIQSRFQSDNVKSVFLLFPDGKIQFQNDPGPNFRHRWMLMAVWDLLSSKLVFYTITFKKNRKWRLTVFAFQKDDFHVECRDSCWFVVQLCTDTLQPIGNRGNDDWGWLEKIFWGLDSEWVLIDTPSPAQLPPGSIF